MTLPVFVICTSFVLVWGCHPVILFAIVAALLVDSPKANIGMKRLEDIYDQYQEQNQKRNANTSVFSIPAWSRTNRNKAKTWTVKAFKELMPG